jgi:hypothetical protein
MEQGEALPVAVFLRGRTGLGGDNREIAADPSTVGEAAPPPRALDAPAAEREARVVALHGWATPSSIRRVAARGRGPGAWQ